MTLFLIACSVLVFFILSGFRVANQYQSAVVFRLGRLQGTRGPGLIMDNLAGLELRRMQMVTEVGAEQNTTTIVMMPSEFVSMAKGIADWTAKQANKQS
ncbi:MAG: hypothetical protein VB032_08975 [Burkholderiaceae bacterium]|nr:hypothetical protein [Burkholderiaceae bacterium]